VGDLRPRRCRRVRGRGRARRALGRGGPRPGRPQARPQPRGGGAAGVPVREAGPLQGPEARRVRARAAQERRGQGPEARHRRRVHRQAPRGGGSMKKLFAVLFAAAVGLAFAQPVTIGILSPLTGGAAGTGQAQRAGFELALKEINEAGGVLGQPLRIVIEDDRADPATAVAAFEKLMTEDGVEFIAGGFSSGATLALVESFRTFQPIASWIGGAAAGTGNDDFDGIEELLGQEEWFFHIHPWDYQNVEATFDFIRDLGVQSVAVLHEDGAFGTPGAAGLEAGVEAMGIDVVLREAFTSTLAGGTGDFRATLSKVGRAEGRRVGKGGGTRVAE